MAELQFAKIVIKKNKNMNPDLKKKIAEMECQKCGNTFLRYQSKVNPAGGKFCSKKCSDLAKKGKSNLLTTKHGMCKTRFYQIWVNMKRRCNSPNDPWYSRYGGRGIKLLWKSFEEFRDDMYKSYLEHCEEFGEKNTTIDRADNNGNYEKSNCRWATWTIQSRNSSNCVAYKNEELKRARQEGYKAGLEKALEIGEKIKTTTCDCTMDASLYSMVSPQCDCIQALASWSEAIKKLKDND